VKEMDASNPIIEFTHQEAFGHLLTGNGVAIGLIEERDQAIVLVNDVLDKHGKNK